MMAIKKLILLLSVPVRLSPSHLAHNSETWVKFPTRSRPCSGHLPFGSACRFHHRGHPISIKTLGFTEVNNVENDSLKKRESLSEDYAMQVATSC